MDHDSRALGDQLLQALELLLTPDERLDGGSGRLTTRSVGTGTSCGRRKGRYPGIAQHRLEIRYQSRKTTAGASRIRNRNAAMRSSSVRS